MNGTRIAVAGFSIALLSGATLLFSGPGARLGLWDFRLAFALMQYAAYGGIAAMAISLLGMMLARRAMTTGLLGIAIGATTLWIPWHQLQAAKSLPPIHDISTDTEHPPEFVAILPLRKDAPNSTEYGGAALAAQQHQAYADVQPLLLELAPPAAFDRALAAARRMGWEIAGTDATTGRVEATATTFWFGFKDDVVVRVSQADSGHSRIDARSVSRVGQSDLGANAARIRQYLAAVREQK